MEMVKSKQDLYRIIDDSDKQQTSKMLLLMVLGTIFLDAYDITILGTMTDQITKEFHLSPTMLSIVMTSLPVGALIGAIFGGSLAHRFGRKRILSISLLILIVTSLCAAISPNLFMLLISRFLMGIAIVISSLVVIMFFLLGVGELLWRMAVAFGGGIALILYIMRLKYLKESPTWIVNHLSLKKASLYIQKHYDVQIQLVENETDVKEIDTAKPEYKRLLKPPYLKRITLATAISTLQGMQYYAVGLYIPIIAKYMISEDKLGVLLGTGIVNIAGIIGAYLGAQYTYRIGTRKLTMIGFAIVLFVMIMTGLLYSVMPMIINSCLIALFLFGHAGGPGTQGKTIGAMSFPTQLRSQATGIVESVSRTGSIIGTFIFPIILATVGLNQTMLIIGLVPLIGLTITFVLKWEPVGKNVENELTS